jgi:uncharacterized protein YacL
VVARRTRGGLIVGELFRLAVVVAMIAAGYTIGPPIAEWLERDDADAVQLVTSLLGGLVGYVVGGTLGRIALRRVDRAQERVGSIDSPVLIAGALGATIAGLLSLVVLSPVLILPGRSVTIPIAVAVLVLTVYAGARIGASRAGDLSRFVGVRGRVEVRSPSRGVGTKLVDSSALIDGRIVEIARCGFLDGTLVIPAFVLAEVQALADAEDDHKRTLGRRGLDTARMLRDDGLVVVEVTEEDPADVQTVDGKLAAICRRRSAALITTDGNLAQVAEVSGVRVLNVHALFEAVRPPAVPGDQLTVRVIKPGTETAQAVGYLDDGTMVVVERAADRLGESLEVDVTSIVSSRRGRMLFAVPSSEGG